MKKKNIKSKEHEFICITRKIQNAERVLTATRQHFRNHYRVFSRRNASHPSLIWKVLSVRLFG